MNYSRLSSLSESLQITIALTGVALLIFFYQSRVEKLLAWLKIEPTTLIPGQVP